MDLPVEHDTCDATIKHKCPGPFGDIYYEFFFFFSSMEICAIQIHTFNNMLITFVVAARNFDIVWHLQIEKLKNEGKTCIVLQPFRFLFFSLNNNNLLQNEQLEDGSE